MIKLFFVKKKARWSNIYSEICAATQQIENKMCQDPTQANEINTKIVEWDLKKVEVKWLIHDQ